MLNDSNHGAINEKPRSTGQNKNETTRINESITQSTQSIPASSSSSSTTTTTMPSSSSFSSQTFHSHLLFALEGLDRFPNYLHRWKEEDIDELEIGLQNQLNKIRQQRTEIKAQRAAIAERLFKTTSTKTPTQQQHDDYDDEQQQQQQQDQVLDTTSHSSISSLRERPQTWEQIEKLLDPALMQVINQSRFFQTKQRPTVDQVLSGNVVVELDAHLLEGLMDQEMYDVYSFPLFIPEFCDSVRNYIRYLKSTIGGDSTSLQMRTRPIDFDTIGLEWMSDLLFHLVVRPISRHLFKDTECSGGDLDWRQAYVASYTAQPESTTATTRLNRLVIHTDDSEVTLNVGLGDAFTGGLLEFWGLRGEHPQRLGDYEPIKGRAVLHAGRHFHQVTQVTHGDRYALILWARSWSAARSQICPCCWMNRRRDNNCLCGPRWN